MSKKKQENVGKENVNMKIPKIWKQNKKVKTGKCRKENVENSNVNNNFFYFINIQRKEFYAIKQERDKYTN
jgi:hypothetical protein